MNTYTTHESDQTPPMTLKRRILAAGGALLLTLAAITAALLTASQSTQPELVISPGAAAAPAPDLKMSITPSKTTPGHSCFTVVNAAFADMGGSNRNCIADEALRSTGFIQSYQVGDGPVAVYGVMPQGKTDSIRIAGSSRVQTEGEMFFMPDVGKVASVRVEANGPTGPWSVDLELPK